MFLTAYQGRTYLFDRSFDEDADDFANHYRVYLMPELSEDDLAGSWTHLPLKAIREIGEVPVNHVHFDSSKRKEVDSSIFEQLNTQLPTG